MIKVAAAAAVVLVLGGFVTVLGSRNSTGVEKTAEQTEGITAAEATAEETVEEVTEGPVKEPWEDYEEDIQEIIRCCEAGEYDEARDVLRGIRVYEWLEEQDGPIIIEAENGKVLGFYQLENGDKIKYMVYYGDYADGERQGEGAWFSQGNTYTGFGEWESGVPNGAWEAATSYAIQTYGSVDVGPVHMSGTVHDGLWDGEVTIRIEKRFDSAYNEDDTFAGSFTDGKWDVIYVMEADDKAELSFSYRGMGEGTYEGMTEYVVAEDPYSPNISGSLKTTYTVLDPEECCSVVGFGAEEWLPYPIVRDVPVEGGAGLEDAVIIG